MSLPRDIKITSDWMSPPSDQSRNRAELAATSQPDVVVVRSTRYPDEQIPLTTRQLRALGQDVQQGQFDHLFRT